MHPPPIASILIIEDDPEQLRLYGDVLNRYRITGVQTVSAALAELGKGLPDLIILDHILDRGERGADYLPCVKAVAAHVPVIIISGTLDIRSQVKALSGPYSADFVLEKPVDIDELERTVEVALTECGFGEAVRMLQSLERSEKTDDIEPDRRFTERLARQHDLLKRLRGSGDRPNISRLSRDCRVSRRTIIRDLRELIQRGQLDAAVYPEFKQELAEDGEDSESRVGTAAGN